MERGKIMESRPIIQIQALTISQKILDQIGSRPWDADMERWTIGWCVTPKGTLVIARNLDDRLYKCFVSTVSFHPRPEQAPVTVKERFPQIFVK
jgi:hypothetical protein